MAPVYDEAMEKIFTNWSLLTAVVEQSRGRESREKRAHLFTEVLNHLQEGSKKRRPPSFENEEDVQDLADFIYELFVQLFQVEADDSSEEQVALFCLKLHNTCHAGDLSFAQAILEENVGVAAVALEDCKGFECPQFATEEEELLAGLQGMNLGGGAEGGSDEDMSDDDTVKARKVALEDEAAAAVVCVKDEPIIDEDGCTLVPIRHSLI